MSLEAAMLAALREKPASGGKLIERLQAGGWSLVPGRAVLVYGALSNLALRGEARVIGEGPGERVYGTKDAPPAPPSPPGHPPSFALGPRDLALVEREVSAITRGLPQHYFEELRRVIVADADRRVFNGEKLPRAAVRALDELGSPAAARAFLRRVERGRPVELRLPRRVRLKWLAAPLALVALGVLARLLVVGIYTLPPESISMAPALVPGAEGGDRIVLANLLASRPRRGDIVVLRLGGELLVKRVMGLPGEAISFQRGDLCVDGRVLVKDRALLDRVKVPLLSLADYRRTDEGWVTDREAREGYRLPDGTVDGPVTPARDVVVLARVRARKAPASVAFELDDGRAKHTVLLETGIGPAVAVAGVEVPGVVKEALRLREGVEHEVWITNADGAFRAEVDGRPAAPAAGLPPGRFARVSVVARGEVDLLSLEVARDLVHEGKEVRLGRDRYLVLGDNGTRSRDSRHFGAVDEDAILGRVFAVAWPPSRARVLR
jgi:type IV secretory pathway protease TraF